MRIRRPLCFVACVVVFCLLPWTARGEEEKDTDLPLCVIPLPVHMERGKGAFMVKADTRIRLRGEVPAHVGKFLADALRRATGHTCGVTTDAAGTAGGGEIVLQAADVALGPEGYRLLVTPQAVRLQGTPAGLFRGVQTVLQLLRDGRLPAVTIDDRPRFGWRGLHLDVGRHLFSVAEVKRFVDLLALFKLNTFHWHLTEDQGWRIEIKRYPKLTEVGAWRSESPQPGDRTKGDGTRYGGFYTQDEIREVVAYAAQRYITIVPEIEMPGHAQAAIAAYPALGNTAEQLAVRTRWGVSQHVYNVEDETFTFLENVLTEVLDLFPGTFVHIGGDECPKAEWKASPRAQARMKAEGLKDEHELQSWFIRRIERLLDSKGRRLIGWDEIQEGGLPPGAAMMVWRSWKHGVEAVRQGHDVVMSPTSHCYFDYYQGDRAFEPEAIGGLLPLERVYSFEPIPPELTAEQAKHVLGAQGNLWTEYMRTFDHLTYMAFPRGAAMAEVTWSPTEKRDFEDFRKRWADVSRHLDALQVNYRIEPPRPVATALVSTGPARVSFEPPPGGGTIRYTLDGSVPDAGARVYDKPIEVERTATVTAVLFRPGGARSAPVTVDVVRHRATAPPPLEPGLRVDGYRGTFARVPDFDGLKTAFSADVDGVAFSGQEPDENFALRYTGYLRVEKAQVYTFSLGSDDGSVLDVAGARVISNDGLHGYVVRTGRVHLEPGVYPLEVGYFERGGAQRLTFEIDGPAALLRPVTERR